jgi:acetylglutamate kinase
VSGPLVLKLGGELLETPADRARVASLAGAIAAQRPLVIVHGGGRAIDAELDRRAIAPKKIDGLRITDRPTLDVVVSVLAGSSNTELVAALVAHGIPAVGLTGVDAGLGKATPTSAYRSTAGTIVDLGFVGDPAETDTSLLELLLVHGYVPVIASLGLGDAPGTAEPVILNVNADVMACRIAAAIGGSELIIAGGTAGVLDAKGESIAMLDAAGIEAVIAGGTATAGMVAKLSACRTALLEGVSSVRIVDGRGLDATHGVDEVPGTTLVVSNETANAAAQSGAGAQKR